MKIMKYQRPVVLKSEVVDSKDGVKEMETVVGIQHYGRVGEVEIVVTVMGADQGKPESVSIRIGTTVVGLQADLLADVLEILKANSISLAS